MADLIPVSFVDLHSIWLNRFGESSSRIRRCCRRVVYRSSAHGDRISIRRYSRFEEITNKFDFVAITRSFDLEDENQWRIGEFLELIRILFGFLVVDK